MTLNGNKINLPISVIKLLRDELNLDALLDENPCFSYNAKARCGKVSFCKYMLPEMACKLTSNFDLIFGILNCNLLKDNIDVDLKICGASTPIKMIGAFRLVSIALGKLRLNPSHHCKRGHSS